jgi:hypothetical protein
MKQRILDVLGTLALLVLLCVAAAMTMPRAYAGMIPTDDRAAVKSMLERPEVLREMEKMGIPPEKAAERVDAMTDEEVRQLAGRLNAVPAGGALSTQDWLLIIIVILLVIIIV